MIRLKMDMDDMLTPVLPNGFLIDAVSRLSAKDACRLKVLSKSWFSLISYNSEFKRLHRLRAQQRQPFLVLADAISDRSSPGLFIEHDTNPLGRKAVFNLKLRSHAPDVEFVACCGDLMCFYNDRVVYVYSPSTNQYLRYDTHVSNQFRIAFVYVASMNLYKVVKLDVAHRRLGSYHSNVFLRFEAITVKEEEQDDQPSGGGGGFEALTIPFSYYHSPWELISEHVMPSKLSGKLGNFIGVNGVVHVTVRLIDFQQAVLLSLGLDDDNNKKHKFATVALPHAEANCCECTTTNNLCQVKDRLCFPHTSTSTIDLWLLEDRYTSSWYKGYTISCNPPPLSILGHSAAADGLFLFVLRDNRIFQHDIRKQTTRILQDGYTPRRIYGFSDNLYSLKNGLRFTRMPADRVGKTAAVPHPLMIEGLASGIPTMALIEVVSRLSAKDACKLKVLSKAWLSLISSNPEFKRLHRLRAPQRPSFLVLAKVFCDHFSPSLFIEDTDPLPDFGGRKVVFNFKRMWERKIELVSSCRDLMCFCNNIVIYIYSPSANQYLCFDILVSRQQPRTWRLGLVYVASKKLYKVVKFEIVDDDSFPASAVTVRFEALTVVQEEEDGTQFGGRGRCDVDKQHQDTPSWELIAEQVKGLDLWLLKDGNRTGIWFKGYTISYNPKPQFHLGQFAYFPHPRMSDEASEGIIVFCVGIELFQYDMGTKEVTYLSEDRCMPVLNVFSDNLYTLKDGLSCNRLPAEIERPVRRRTMSAASKTTTAAAAALLARESVVSKSTSSTKPNPNGSEYESPQVKKRRGRDKLGDLAGSGTIDQVQILDTGTQ